MMRKDNFFISSQYLGNFHTEYLKKDILFFWDNQKVKSIIVTEVTVRNHFTHFSVKTLEIFWIWK